jgi:hypothetical protein
VHPVPAAGGLAGILAVLDGRGFTVRNPFDRRVKIVLDVRLPRVLATKGWKVDVSTAGGSAFALPPGEPHPVRLAVTPGSEVSGAEVKATADRDVVVSVTADGILIGGMTYRLDPDRSEPLPQEDTVPSDHDDDHDHDRHDRHRGHDHGHGHDHGCRCGRSTPRCDCDREDAHARCACDARSHRGGCGCGESRPHRRHCC